MNNQKHKTIVFVGPSAIGKTYAALKLLDEFPDKINQAKLYTTRKPRQNEPTPDRIFITNNKFEEMCLKNEFVIHDIFSNNRYGYTKEAIYPQGKTLIVNAWPELSKKLTKLPHVILIGMQAPKNWQNLLINRMLQRGDSQKTIKARIKIIEKDIDNLNEMKHIIQKHGKYVIVNDDSTIENQVIPWIRNKLGL